MSIVAHGGFALVPSASSPEGLTKRLLSLRAEIDAILVELVSHAMAAPQQGQPMPAMTVAPAILAETMAPAHTTACAAPEHTSGPAPITPLSDEKPQPEPCDAGEAETAGEPAESLAAPDLIHAAAPEQPVAEPIAPEHPEAPILLAQEGEWAAPKDAQSLSVAKADTDGTEHLGDGSPAPETPAPSTVEASASGPATEFAAAHRHDDVVVAAIPDEAEPAAEATESGPYAGEGAAHADIMPLAAAVPTSPADNAEPVAPPATVESPAVATVIDFQERQRKQAELVADAPMAVGLRPTRIGGRIAAKIAASILLLITAAMAMVASDRNAFGMAQSLPWMTQAPSTPTPFVWLLKRFKDGVARASEAGREAWGG